MTIHHDKSVYGKLSALTEEYSEEKLIELASKLEERTARSEPKTPDAAQPKKEK